MLFLPVCLSRARLVFASLRAFFALNTLSHSVKRREAARSCVPAVV